jgi:phosphopantetheine attachment domain protein
MKEKIREIVNEFANKELPDETSAELIESGYIDSLGIFSILSGLEDEFGIEIEAEDISKSNFGSIDSMADMVLKYRSE